MRAEQFIIDQQDDSNAAGQREREIHARPLVSRRRVAVRHAEHPINVLDAFTRTARGGDGGGRRRLGMTRGRAARHQREHAEQPRSGYRLGRCHAGTQPTCAELSTRPGVGAPNRSCNDLTCGARERSAIAASHAADAADIVVQYGTLRVIAMRRIA